MTHFTILWLGTTISQAVLALANILPGSAVLGGNLFFDTTNNAAPAIYVDANQVLTPTASGLGFPTNGSQTGVTLKAGSVTAFQTFPVACTSTGGLTKYPTCVTSSPYSTTGALLELAIDCGNTRVAMVMSGSFVKTNSATTFGASVLRNVTVGTGSLRNRLSQTGSQITWNPADKIRLTTTTATANSAANCTMWVTARDKSGT